MNKNDKIVILGITGYMGAWLAKQLFDQGFKNISGSFRNHEKMDYLVKELPGVTGIEADLLTSPEKITILLKDAKWVFNNTAPFTGKEETMEDFIQTKITVVNNLFKAIDHVGTVEKMVHLGSAGAIGFGNSDPDKKIITEDDLTDLDHLDYPYEKFMVIKTYETRCIWELSQLMDVKTTILHPTNVIGPSFTPWHHDMIYAYLNNGTYLADGPMDSVDVRDIAAEEIALMDNPKADGKEVLGIGFSLPYSELVKITEETLSPTEISQLFSQLPEIIPTEVALALWAPINYTSFYKDHAWRLVNKITVQTKYPDFYNYQHTDAKTTIQAALRKMLADL